MAACARVPPMSRSLRARLPVNFALAVVVGMVAAATIAATALAAGAVHYEPEELPALEAQLHHGEVHAVAFHPGTGTGHIHVSLNGGRHMTVLYSDSEQAHLLALVRADHVPVAVATAKAKASKPVHHKLRYIAGGIVIVVIVVVAAVLLIDRRRKLGESGFNEAGEGGAGGTQSADSAPAPSSSGDPT